MASLTIEDIPDELREAILARIRARDAGFSGPPLTDELLERAIEEGRP